MRRVVRLALAILLAASACNRAIEPFDPDEKVEAPDLSRIFPEGAQRAAAAGRAEAGADAPTRGAAPPGAPAPGEPAPGTPPPGAPPEAISGTVRLAPELEGRVPAGAVLFLMARQSETGPPVAVVRVPDPRFPFDFRIGPEDRMIEAVPFQGPFALSVRVDADRNAMTRTPGDLQGEAAARVAPGSRGVELVIDEIL